MKKLKKVLWLVFCTILWIGYALALLFMWIWFIGFVEKFL